jgi:uncharacterized membrane protein YfcA
MQTLSGARTLDRRVVAVTTLIGLAAGLASGLLGVGGGIVIVPLLVMAVGLSQHRAHATSLAAIVPIATVAAIPYAVSGHADYGIAGCLAVGGLVGAPIGSRALGRSDESTLKILFGLLMIAVSIELLWP